MIDRAVESIKLGLLLGTVGVISAFALSFTYSITKENIEQQKHIEALSSLPVVLPEAKKFSDEKSVKGIRYFDGQDANGQIVGYALYGENKGYQSTIKFMIGIDAKGNIKGLRILEQAETPGLGARITEIKSDETIGGFVKGVMSGEKDNMSENKEPWFTEMFKNKFYKNIYITKTDKNDNAITAITGATITSAAVVEGVKGSIDKFLTLMGEK